MAGLLMLVILSIIPAGGAGLGWLLFHRRSPALAWLAGLLLGVGPLSWFGWTIYRHEGGNGDPDPLAFFQMATGLAVAATLLTLFALHLAARRAE
ncbi:MAG: hypothetical protein ACREB7_10555 [Sphingopyxis sp.]|uniref:hypothetical protein n=1 Tax=Sphingopyxis sp. TaxID=1908224 RepID=UPI003D6D6614